MVLVVQRVFCLGVPDLWLSVLRATDEEPTIWTDATLDHKVIALGTEESSPYPRSMSALELKESDAVVPGMHVHLVVVLRMRDDLVDLVSFQFFLFDHVGVDKIQLVV